MAAPTAPTLATLVAEAFKKAGISSPSSADTTRAQDLWMEEIKNDIWQRCTTLKSLMKSNYQEITNGLGRYSNPSDYASDMNMQFLTGLQYGTAQTGTTTSLTLASDEDLEPTSVIGSELVIYDGTGENQSAYITNYDNSTKIATLAPTLTTAGDNSSKYLIVDYKSNLSQCPVWNFDKSGNPVQGEPCEFYPIGDSLYGSYLLNPVPYRTDSQPMVLFQRYYSNLLRLDLTSTLISTLYLNWRNVWLAGLKFKALADIDDNRQEIARGEYEKELRELIMKETYGHEINNLQSKVCDY